MGFGLGAGRESERRLSRAERTVEDWIHALAARGTTVRRVGRDKYRGAPCPACGGGQKDRFELSAGRLHVLASCWSGCKYADIRRAVFGDDAPRPRPRPRRPTKADVEAARKRKRKAAAADRRRAEHVRKLWADASAPDPATPPPAAHPAQRWAARRNLWNPAWPWPPSIRWAPVGKAGTLVCAFRPLAWWIEHWTDREAHDEPPTCVELVHVGRKGKPRQDAGGLDKRNRGAHDGACAGRVLMVAPPDVAHVGDVLHVGEGLADSFGLAAHHHAPALHAGGKEGVARLGRSAGALGAWTRVVLHADADDDGAGLEACREALSTMRRPHPRIEVMRYPDGLDPAAWTARREPPW